MNWLIKLFRRATLADAVRASVLNMDRNMRTELVEVPEWGQSVYLRGLTVGEWHEYGRMAALLTPRPEDAEDDAPVPDEQDKLWLKFGVRALYAFALVAVLRDAQRMPVFAPAGSPQRAQDIADVAASFTHVHDGLASQIFKLSGIEQGDEGEPSDPVADAGNA